LSRASLGLPKVVSEYRCAHVSLPFFLDFCNSIYLFYLVPILSFDACIVTITWARLCVVISLWFFCLAFIELFSLGFVEDRVIEVGVSFFKL
jgi:hypothetical protein